MSSSRLLKLSTFEEEVRVMFDIEDWDDVDIGRQMYRA